jgi:hypothetical protein
VTLRQALGGDTRRLHEVLDQLLDREDAVILLFDGDRAVNFIGGFGLSPSQHELMALEIERVLRAAGATTVVRTSGTEPRQHLDKAA